MRCTNCQGVWTPLKNVLLSNCPFCQTDILQALNDKIEELAPEVILRNILYVHGMEILQKKQRLSALISVFFAHDKRVMKMLLLSVKEKVPQKILSLKDDNELETRLNAIKIYLKEDAFLNDEIASQMILVWRFLLNNWNEPEAQFEIAWNRGYCGFRNSKDKMITSFYYDDAKMFHDGLAAVKKFGKWGFIDMRGNMIIPLIYNDVNNFSEGLAGVAEDYLWGVIDKKGNQIIPYEFGKVEMFMEGLAVVQCSWANKYGYIDHQGEVVIPMDYDMAYSFANGIARVQVGQSNNYLHIDCNGNKVSEFSNMHISNDANILDADFRISEVNGKYGFVNSAGKEIVAHKYDWVGQYKCGHSIIRFNDKYGFIDKNGLETFVPCLYLNDFSEGIAKVNLDAHTRHTFINTDGEIITPKIFDTAYDFIAGTASVSLKIFAGYDFTYQAYKVISGRINKRGLWVYSERNMRPECKDYNFLYCYDYVRTFSDGLIAVSFNYKWGYVDMKGKVVIPLKYGLAYNFIDGLAKVRDATSEKYGFIDIYDNIPVQFLYDDVSDFHRGLAIVRINDYWGCIDKTGGVVIPVKFQNINLFSRFENLISVKFNEKWGFVDFSANEIIQFEYTKLGYCKEGLLLVNIGGRYIKGDNGDLFEGGLYGAVDEHGNEIIPVMYESLGYMRPAQISNCGAAFFVNKDDYENKYNDEEYWIVNFYQGITRFYRDGKYGLIDKKGNELKETCEEDDNWEEEFNDIDYGLQFLRPKMYDFIFRCETGLIKVKNKSKYGYIDKDGDEIVKCKYDSLADFSQGLAKANIGGRIYYDDGPPVFEGGLWGYVNLIGEEQIPIIYEEIDEGEDGFYNVSLKGKSGIIDNHGNWINNYY